MMTSSFFDFADPDKIAAHINETQLNYFKEHIGTLIETHLLGDVLLKATYGEAPNTNMDEKTFINGGFIDLLKGSFYNEEQNLILKLSGESEHIKYGFAYFSILNTENRFIFAKESADQQRKAAWEFAEYKYPFGNLDNQLNISRNKIAASVFPNTATPAHPYPYINIGEAITGILESNKALTEDEKMIIGNLATFLTTSGAPQETANYGIISPEDMSLEQKDECHDLAYIETAIEALFIAQNEIEENKDTLEEPAVIKDLQPFWNQTSNELRTDEARKYFTVLEELNDRDVPLLLPDTVIEYVQGQVLTRGTGGMHPHNHDML